MNVIALEIVAAVVIFAAGVFVGDRNASTIEAAIAAVQKAEGEAKAILSKITAHKAG